MGSSISRCVEEQVCGGEEEELASLHQDFLSTRNDEQRNHSVITKILITPPDEEDLLNKEFESKISNSFTEGDKLSLIIDSCPESTDQLLDSDSPSDESVMSAISPTKDINRSKKSNTPRSFVSSPIQNPGLSVKDPNPFYLSPIRVNKTTNPLGLSYPFLDEIVSIHEIENAILFNDMKTLLHCPSKEFMFTKFHFQNYQLKQALHLAVLSNQVEMVQYILSFSPDVFVKDQEGETAISLAQTIGNPAILQLLLQYLPNDTPLSPFPGNSSVLTSSYQESVDDARIFANHQFSELSIRLDPSIKTTQNTQSDWTENESQATSMLSGKSMNPYKRFIPRKIRKAAKHIVHLMGSNHTTNKKGP